MGSAKALDTIQNEFAAAIQSVDPEEIRRNPKLREETKKVMALMRKLAVVKADHNLNEGIKQ